MCSKKLEIINQGSAQKKKERARQKRNQWSIIEENVGHVPSSKICRDCQSRETTCEIFTCRAGVAACWVNPLPARPAFPVRCWFEIQLFYIQSSCLLICLMKQLNLAQLFGPLHSCGRSKWNSRLLVLVWPTNGSCDHLSNEPESLLLSSFLLYSPSPLHAVPSPLFLICNATLSYKYMTLF